MKKWVSPIPKDIHLIWIGGDPPDYFQKFLGTFEELNDLLSRMNKVAFAQGHSTYMFLANFTYSDYVQNIEEKTKKYEK